MPALPSAFIRARPRRFRFDRSRAGGKLKGRPAFGFRETEPFMPTRLIQVCGCLLLLVSVASADEPKVPDDWAYKPVVKQAVPKVAGKSITAVDSFLLAKLEAKKLLFAPPADKATLLRRV